MKLTLVFGFLLTAALYASVGFGGGSSYTALLAISGISYTLIPVISLLCNICVVSGNSWRYFRGGYIKLSQVWPLFLVSIPAAMIGGMLRVSEALYLGLLCLALLLASLRMVFGSYAGDETAVELAAKYGKVLSGILGGLIGFISGIVGIGGGIFLAPVLYRLGWGRGSEQGQNIAAACSLFILVNSIAGLAGQISKNASAEFYVQILPYWPLILAVLLGGTFGNMFSLHFFKAEQLRRVTGVLILIVAIRLIFKWVSMAS